MTLFDNSINNPPYSRAGSLRPFFVIPVIHVFLYLIVIPNTEHAAPRRMEDRHTEWWPPTMELVNPLSQNCGRGNYNDRFVKHIAVM